MHSRGGHSSGGGLHCNVRPGRTTQWTRTPDTRIMIPRTTPHNPGENALSPSGAAGGAAVVRENALLDPDLAAIIECWPDLPESVKTAVMEMVRG